MLVGGAPGGADEAGAVLQRNHPGLLPPTTHIGTPKASGDSEARDTLKRCDPHLVLVAYGAPAQEQWIERNLAGFSSIVGIGVGGALDYISGRVARAPNPIRKAGLEWRFRLAVSPGDGDACVRSQSSPASQSVRQYISAMVRHEQYRSHWRNQSRYRNPRSTNPRTRGDDTPRTDSTLLRRQRS